MHSGENREKKTLTHEEQDAVLAELIKIVGDLLNGRPVTEPPASGMFLWSLASRNVMDMLLASSEELIGFASAEDSVRLRETRMRKSRALSKQDYEYQSLRKLLNENGIRYLPLKGILLRELYPVRDMRTSNDLDILYDKDERARLFRMLEENGYEAEKNDPNHGEFRINGITIEMHHNLFTDDPALMRYYRAPFSRLEKADGCEYRFTPEDEYVYTVLHAMKHICYGGSDLRPLPDLYLIDVKKHPDRETISRELKELGITAFEERLRTLYTKWFAGDESPTRQSFTDDEWQLLRFMAFGGVGKDTAYLADSMGGGGARRKLIVKRLFPPLLRMRESYPILGKLPILLPVCWLIRIVRVYVLHPKTARKAGELAGLADDAEAEKRRRFEDAMRIAGLDRK